jgi:hypothetical protein
VLEKGTGKELGSSWATYDKTLPVGLDREPGSAGVLQQCHALHTISLSGSD